MSGDVDDDTTGLIDIGHGVRIRYTSWDEYPRVGLIEYHACHGGNCVRSDTGEPGLCGGGLLFDLPGVREAFPGRALWRVESWEPLTITPSVQCGCTGCRHHGWIQEGRWRPA